MNAWHYTITQRAVGIINDGVIRPATVGVAIGEKPIVWFSTHPTWEPTACKGVMIAGRMVRLSMRETIDRGGGAWRFGLPTDQLTYWRKLIGAAGMKKQQARSLENVGREQGADPSHWYGSLEPIDVNLCIPEVMSPSGEWVDAVKVGLLERA